MIAASTVRALRDHLATTFGLTYVDPRDKAASLALRGVALATHAAAAFVGRTLGLDAAALGDLVPDLATTSLTLGPLVVLSDAAVASPLSELETIVHEAQHGAQEADGGFFRAAIDYLSAELRARAEADAYAAGLFARWLVTGIAVDPEEAVARLVSGAYHLAPGELALARGIVRSHVATIGERLCPPLSAAIETLAFLHKFDRSAIVVDVQ